MLREKRGDRTRERERERERETVLTLLASRKEISILIAELAWHMSDDFLLDRRMAKAYHKPSHIRVGADDELSV